MAGFSFRVRRAQAPDQKNGIRKPPAPTGIPGILGFSTRGKKWVESRTGAARDLLAVARFPSPLIGRVEDRRHWFRKSSLSVAPRFFWSASLGEP